MKTLVGCVIVAVVGIAGVAAAEDRHEIGGLSFALPGSWKYEEPAAGADHVRLTYLDQKRYCIVSLYASRATTAKLPAEFLAEWKSVAGSISGDTPKSSTRKVGGRAVMEASGMITAEDQSRLFERFSVIDGKGQIATLIVLTATAATSRACQADSDKIAASVKFPAAAPASAAPAPAPAQSAPAPAANNGLAGTLKASITLADLAGTWSDGAGVVSYRDTSNGGVSGSSAAVVGMKYVFTAAGTFAYDERGRYGNMPFHNTDKGTLALDGSDIVLTSSTRVRRFQLLAFMTLDKGAAVLTLQDMGSEHKPMTAEAIASFCGPKDGVFRCAYGLLWSRQPTAK